MERKTVKHPTTIILPQEGALLKNVISAFQNVLDSAPEECRDSVSCRFGVEVSYEDPFPWVAFERLETDDEFNLRMQKERRRSEPTPSDKFIQALTEREIET